MSQKLNVSTEEVAARLQSLRKQFKSNWRRAQADDTFEVKWRFYSSLTFMAESFQMSEANESQSPEKKKKSQKRPAPKSTPALATATVDNSVSTTANDNAGVGQTNESAQQQSSNSSSTSAFLGFSPPRNGNASAIVQPESRQANADDADCDLYIAYRDSMNLVPKMETNRARNFAQPTTDRDRIDRFFRSIADTVETFPPRVFAEVKMNISALIGQIELQLIDGTNGVFENRNDEQN